MDWQKFEQRCAITFCVKLGESATVNYGKLKKMLVENIPCPGHKSVFEGEEKVDNEPHAGRTSTLKNEQHFGNSRVSCEEESFTDIENDRYWVAFEPVYRPLDFNTGFGHAKSAPR
jgi:hypothetical protein